MRIHPSFCIIKNKDKHWLTMLMDFFEFWGFPVLMTHSKKKTPKTSDDKGFIFWLGSTHNLKYQNCFTLNEINSGEKKQQPQESSCQVSGSPLCLLLYTVNHALDGSSDGLINYNLFSFIGYSNHSSRRLKVKQVKLITFSHATGKEVSLKYIFLIKIIESHFFIMDFWNSGLLVGSIDHF